MGRVSDRLRYWRLITCVLLQVKIHYTWAHAPSTVVKTIQANVATLGFIERGLPGQPEGLVS